MRNIQETIDTTFEDINRESNDKGVEWQLSRLDKQTHERGISMGYYYDHHEGASTKEIALMHLPFANSILDPHMQVRADVLRKLLVEADVRDEAGDQLPVIAVSAPNKTNRYEFDEEQTEAIEKGFLGPVTERILQESAFIRNAGRISVIGFSQGADVGLAGVKYLAKNHDVGFVSLGDPAGTASQSLFSLGKNFLSTSMKQVEQEVANSGLELLDAAFELRRSDLRFALDALTKESLSIAKGMSKGQFIFDLMDALSRRNVESVVVGMGDNSTVSRQYTVKEWLQNISNDLSKKSVAPYFEAYTETEATHAYGDNLRKLGKQVLKASLKTSQ